MAADILQSAVAHNPEIPPFSSNSSARHSPYNLSKLWKDRGYAMLAPTPILLAWLVGRAMSIPSPISLGTDVTLLVQNDLNWHTTSEHQGSLLLDDALSYKEAVKACNAFNEKLLSTAGPHFRQDLKQLLGYAAFNKYTTSSHFWVDSPSPSQCRAVSLTGEVRRVDCGRRLQPICSQSAPYRRNTDVDPNPAFHVQLKSKQLNVTGTRDHLSFRFVGIPYANPVERFAYSQVHDRPATISALKYGPACAQRSTGSEDCLTLNIYTPYIPVDGSRSNKLRPVMLWIHGGGFTDGQSSDSVFDGGNLVSRGDVVVVSINYRLGTLGFLALNDGVTNGNFGIADQITALQWVHAHIKSFGGDPSRVTTFGQSAGAGSVRALLASPLTQGLFAGAIAQSPLGGFGYAHAYSWYLTIEQEYEGYARNVIESVGCSGAEDVLSCLRQLPAASLQTAPDAPRYIVVDGKYITSDELKVDGSGPNSNVHVILGWTRDDGSDFIGAWPKGDASVTAIDILTRSGLSVDVVTKALESGLFPLPQTRLNATWNLWNQTSRVATAGMFSCIDQATVIAAAKHQAFKSIHAYQFDRTYIGWEPIAGTCGPSSTPEHPNGDMSLPYFRCHSGELAYMFGTLGQDSLPFRDPDDLLSQLSVDIWTSFARTYDPNPSSAYLAIRGYTNTAEALRKGGKWEAVKPSSKLPLRRIDAQLWSSEWVEEEQCQVLGYPLDLYNRTGERSRG